MFAPDLTHQAVAAAPVAQAGEHNRVDLLPEAGVHHLGVQVDQRIVPADPAIPFGQRRNCRNMAEVHLHLEAFEVRDGSLLARHEHGRPRGSPVLTASFREESRSFRRGFRRNATLLSQF